MNNIIQFPIYLKRKRKRYKGDYMCEILEKIRNKKPNELLFEYGVSTAPPVDVSELLKKIGISSIEMDFSEIEDIKNEERGSILGAAFSNGNNLAIFYKKNDSYHRQLFTIAHELGHCCLHADNLQIEHIQYRKDNDNPNKKEKDANIFAGELLIPKQKLLEYYNKFIIPSLTTLSQIFNVSTNVMAARLDYLNLNYYKDSEISEE